MFIKLLKKALISLLALNFIACSLFTPASRPTAADIEKEKQAVYASFFGSNPETIVILQDTSTNISSDDIQQSID